MQSNRERRRAASVSPRGLLAAGATLGCLGVIAASLASLLSERWWFFDLFTHFTGYWMVAAGVALILAIAARSRGLVIIAAAGLFGHAVTFAELWPRAESSSAASGARLTVLQFNVNTANPRRDEIMRYLKAASADIVLVMEVGPEWVAPLEAWGAQLIHPARDNFGIALWTRLPLQRLERVGYSTWGMDAVHAVVEWRGGPLLFIGAHPVPPLGADYASSRDQQLAEMAAHVRTATVPVIVAGDLNATPWSAALRQFVADTGLSSAHQGYEATWRPSLIVGLPIDHTFHDGYLRAVSRTLGPPLGSDHVPIVTVFAPTAPSAPGS